MSDPALLLTELLVVLTAARLVGRGVQMLDQPRVVGEMLAGIALGPSLFGAVAPGAMHALFPPGRLGPLGTISQLGVTLFMFVVGLRLDVGLLRGRLSSTVLVSHASIVVPFILGGALAPWLYPELAGPEVAFLPFALFLGAAMSITAFPVLARILIERGLQSTRLGSIALACAAVDDVTAWCLLAGVVTVARVGSGAGESLKTLLGVVVFAVVVVTLGKTALRAWCRSRAVDESASGDGVVAVTILLALGSALVTELLGVHPLFGAFLAGTIVPREGGVAMHVASRIEYVVVAVLLPVFFAFTGLRTEIGLLDTPGLWIVCGVIIATAVAGKFGGSTVAARITGMSWRDSVAIGLLMNTRGLMELVILNIGLEIGVIGQTLFTMMVLMAVATTVMTSPLLRLVLGPLDKAPQGTPQAVRQV